MKKGTFEDYQLLKKQFMHYDEMSDKDKRKFDQQMDNIKIEYEIKNLKHFDCIDSKQEGDYINEEDLMVDEAL